MVVKSDKKIIKGWVMYDWANSVYSLTITTAVFPIYYTAVTMQNGSDLVSFLDWEEINTALYSYALSFAFLTVAFLSPLLSGIADYTGRKKDFMKFFCYMGSIACAGLYFFTGPDTVSWGIFCSIVACIGYAGSFVFYNAYLPEIAPPQEIDAVSASGYSYGYIGSVLLLLINLIMIQFPESFGLSDGAEASRISFVMVGLWWAGFAQITFKRLPSSPRKNGVSSVVLNGYKELINVWKSLKKMRILKLFLLSFFFYNMGVQTIMYVSTLFGTKELQMDDTLLILTVFLIQLIAIAGAYGFSYLSSKISNFKTLMTAVALWIIIALFAYFIQTSGQFIALALLVGLVMGGIQSLSRSTYAKLLPPTKDTASFFSFYDFIDKISIVLGTFFYGYIEVLTGSMRGSVLLFALVLSLSFFLLWRLTRIAQKESMPVMV